MKNKKLLFKKFNYSIPMFIMIFGVALSFINNFGWDLVQTDNLTYLTSLFSGGLGLLIHNALNNPEKVKEIIKTLSILLEELEADDSDGDDEVKGVSDESTSDDGVDVELVRCTGRICGSDCEN